jgi:hypothetical protein
MRTSAGEGDPIELPHRCRLAALLETDDLDAFESTRGSDAASNRGVDS